jgi:hypothetical protein
LTIFARENPALHLFLMGVLLIAPRLVSATRLAAVWPPEINLFSMGFIPEQHHPQFP